MVLLNLYLCIKRTSLVITLFFLSFTATAQQAITQQSITQQPITVLVPNFPPYTENVDDKIVGIGIELANKAFRKAGIAVNYRLMPNYAKVISEIKQGRGDAFLLASQNDERDDIAVFSQPLLINRWCWYVLKQSRFNPTDNEFKQQAIVSSHFNANTHKWLIENEYSVQPVMETAQLPQMLIRRHIDAAFIAELVFDEALKRAGIDENRFEKYVEKRKAFGIYLSKHYLKQSPKALDKINSAIIDMNQ